MKDLLNWLKWENDDQLLSIGCGSAWWEINLLFNQPCQKMYLVDPNADLLNENEINDTIQYFERHYHKKWDIPIQLFNQDAQNLNLPTNSLDGVFIFNALHEMENQMTILQKCKSLCRKGAFVCVEEELSMQSRLNHQGCGLPLFYQEELIQLFESAGFQFSDILKKDEIASYFLFLTE